ncbi:2-oxo acid dehydrogenase subunit E2 [Nautilia sp.]
MEYKVTMPVLSDTMDKGKITKWYVKPGDYVKKGDKLCEVESDKAVMDIESFEEGVVKEIVVKEGEEVEVKSVIAIIETMENEEKKKSEKNEKLKVENEEKKESEKNEKLKVKNEDTGIKEPETEKPEPKQPEEKNEIDLDDIINSIVSEPKSKIKGTASPAAKKEAEKLGIDIEKLQHNGTLPTPAHYKDIEEIKLKRYFTPKALKLLKEYGISPDEFETGRKISSEEVLKHIKKHNIPKISKLDANRLVIIKNVENSAKKPVFFVFEEIELSKREYKITAYLIKALANAMQKHPLTRSVLKNDTLLTYPSSNISVAVNRKDGLFMCVIKNAEEKNLKEINEWLKTIKTKKLNVEDISGSTFGISNLGMYEIDRFSALINGKDSAIAAFGTLTDNRIKVTFTFDHRIINGAEAALFVHTFKEEIKNV